MSLQLNGTDGVTFNDGSEQWAAASPIGTKNIIINGDMRIAQRATSVTGISNSAEYRTVDRWKFAQQSSSGVFTMSQDTDVPVGQGFTYSVKMQCTTAQASLGVNDRIAIWQGIEGNMLQSYIKGTNATKATLSFWVKTNKTGTYNLELNDTDNNRHICNTFTVTTADTWQKITWVIDADTGGNPFDNGVNGGMYVNIVFGAGSNYQSGTLATTWSTPVTQGNRYVGASNLADSTSNYINITGVQLEVGDTATPFENRPYDMELQRCQRYFQKSWAQGTAVGTAISIDDPNAVQQAWGSSNSGGIAGQAFLLPVVMRATPTLLTYDTNLNQGKVTILYAGANGDVNISYNQISSNDSKFRVRMYANSAYGLVFAYTLTAEI